MRVTLIAQTEIERNALNLYADFKREGDLSE